MANSKVVKDKLKFYIESNILSSDCGLLLSGGVDSASLLFILLEIGIKPTVYSFTLEGHESTDFRRARSIALDLNLDFVPVYLSTDLDKLLEDLIELCMDYPDIKSKTDFECFWPLSKAFNAVEEKNIITGLASDGHFGLSKKAMIHYKDNPNLFNEAREKAFNSETYAQKQLCFQYSWRTGKNVINPYRSNALAEYLRDFNWYELNTPKQKDCIVNMFPTEFKKYGSPKHINLQCGDSGIQDLFQRLTTHSCNKNGSKSSTGVFNQIKKQVNGI